MAYYWIISRSSINLNRGASYKHQRTQRKGPFFAEVKLISKKIQYFFKFLPVTQLINGLIFW